MVTQVVDIRHKQGLARLLASLSFANLRVAKDRGGFILIETLMATVLLGVAVLVFLTTLATGSKAVDVVGTRIESNRLAQSQMEFTLSEPYLFAPATYPSIAAPAGYTVTVGTESLAGTGPNIQRIIVSVYRNGQPHRTLEAFKFNQ